MISYQLDYKVIKPITSELSICLGYFDGVHLGHQKIISEAIKNASYPVGVLTFSKPVSYFLDNNKSKDVITSLNDRFKIISHLNPSFYFVLHIDKEFLSLDALDFIKMLKAMNVKEVFVGEDYHFGKNKQGDVSLLKDYFDVHVIKLLYVDGKKVSTQSIISLIKDGDVKTANKLLGHNYYISGTVSEGHHNGEKFGIRTANIKLDSNYIIPKFGVYKVIIYIDGVPHLSIANVGVHPTIDKEDKPVLEVHIPNYDKSLYNEAVYVEFIDFVRKEKCFKNTDELVKQIKEDIRKVSQC